MVNLESPQKYGQRRSILDMISMTVENENPMYSLMKKGGRPTGVLDEWTADKEAAPKDNAVPDGHDFSEFENFSKDIGLIRNRVQLMQRGGRVTTLMQEVSDIAGMKSVIGREKMKALKAMIGDIEAALGSDNEAAESTGAEPGQGGRMRGMGKWMQSTAQANEPVPAQFRMDAGQILATNLAAFTEAVFKTMMQKNYEVTGARKAYMGVFASGLKAHVDGFTSKSTATTNIPAYTKTWERSAKERSLGDIVDRLESSFGSVNLILSNRLALFSAPGHSTRRGYIFDPSQWELLLLKAPTYKDLPDGGGGPRFMYDAIVGNRCYNPQQGAKIAVSADS